MINSYDVAILSEKVAKIEERLSDTPAISDLIKVKTYTAENVSVLASGNGNLNPATLVEADTTMSEYTPVGIVGYKTNNAAVYIANLIYGDNNSNIILRNTTDEALTINVSYDVLFIKSST